MSRSVKCRDKHDQTPAKLLFVDLYIYDGNINKQTHSQNGEEKTWKRLLVLLQLEDCYKKYKLCVWDHGYERHNRLK